MSLTITEPIKTVNGMLTKAIAAESQLLYLMERKDYPVADFLDDAGNVLLNIAGTDNSEFINGDALYVGFPTGSPYKDGVYTILNSTVSGNVKITINAAYISDAFDGYTNLITARPDYRIEVEVRDKDDTFSLFDQTFLYIPSQNGLVTIDVGGILSNYMRDLELFSFEYFLRVKEVWAGIPSPTPPIIGGVSDSTVDEGGNVQGVWWTDGLVDTVKIDDWYQYGDGTGFYGGVYRVIAVDLTPGTNRITFDTPFLGAGGYLIKQPYAADTTILQAILAKKQILSKGGANMWENLLRAKIIYENEGVQENGSDVGSIEIVLNWDEEGNPATGVDLTGHFTVGQMVYLTFNAVYTDGYYPVKGFRYHSELTRIGFYIPFTENAGGSITTQEVGKLLTKFTNGLMWRGWNRTANYLIDNEILNRNGGLVNTRIGVVGCDINKGLITPSGITRNVETPKVLVENISTIAYPQDDGRVRYVRTEARQSDSSEDWTEQVFYKLEDGDCNNPIMLDWINSLGGIEQHLFTLVRIVNIETDAGVLAESPIYTDIEYITRTKRRFARSFRQRMIMNAVGLTLDQLQALEELKNTESLRVYLTKDGTEWVDAVVIDDFNTEYHPEQRRHNFTVTIELPDNFKFEDAKKY